MVSQFGKLTKSNSIFWGDSRGDGKVLYRVTYGPEGDFSRPILKEIWEGDFSLP